MGIYHHQYQENVRDNRPNRFTVKGMILAIECDVKVVAIFRYRYKRLL